MLKKPIILIFGCLLIVIAGLSSTDEMSVDLFPDLNYPLINVITHYQAGTAEDMELLISSPIEIAMMGLTQLQRVRSSSSAGFSQVTVEFNWGVDVEQARQRVFARLSQIQDRLPKDARPQIENVGSSLSMLSTYLLESKDTMALQTWVKDQLSNQISRLPGVARVHVMGDGGKAWRVDLDPLKLKQIGLSVIQLNDVIKRSNILDTGGYITKQGRDLLVHTDARLLTISDLKHVLVAKKKDGSMVVLSDVAEVYVGSIPQRYAISKDTRPAVAITIQKQLGANSLTVSKNVDNFLQQAKDKFPIGVRISKFYDQGEIIRLSYNTMKMHLLFGALLSIIAVIFFLGFNRIALAIAISFPVTLMGSIWVMHRYGLSFNLMTLGALTVAIGMVVDDAIIVMENIDRHRANGCGRWRAVTEGTKEILTADIAGTLTILVAFAPLLLVDGLVGRIFHPFAIAFGALLLFSFLVSISVIPLCSYYWSKPMAKIKVKGERIASLADRWVDYLTEKNILFLKFLLRHKKSSISLTIVILTFTLLLLAYNPIRMLPLLDENSLLVSYQLAPGTSLNESTRLGKVLEKRILELPTVSSVFRRTGSPANSFFLEGTNQGEIVVRLSKDTGKTVVQMKTSLDKIINTMPGVVGRVNEPTTEKLEESFSGISVFFGITVFSPNLDELYLTTAKIEKIAKQIDGIQNVVNNTKIPVDEIQIKLDKNRLALRNVSPSVAAKVIKMSLQGNTATVIALHQNTIKVFLSIAKKSLNSVEKLATLFVPNRDGVAVPVSQLSTISVSSGYPSIEHQQAMRSLTMSAEIEGNPIEIIDTLNDKITQLNLPDNTRVSYTGEYKQLIDTLKKMLVVLLGSIVLVYGIMVLQLGNFIDPLVVLVKLPLDFAGAALALFLTGQSIDLTILIGFITLVGVSTNNGIMLLTFTRNFRRQGMNALDAILKAVRIRMRPMLLTHITTILALIPAALGLSEGPQLLQPLGVMLFGGLTAGTLLTLSILPVIYVATERWR